MHPDFMKPITKDLDIRHLIKREENQDIIQERDRYKAALEFYANDKNWLQDREFGVSKVGADLGATAQEALKR